MARIINSPGVQITEQDLSLRIQAPVGTTVVVPGFAAQGPISEPLFVTSISELETIYGAPTTPAEQYFFYSCKEILNSPANLTTVRLPYGSDLGDGYDNSYTGLFFPVLSSSSNSSVSATWTIGTPFSQKLTPTHYRQILAGNFVWGTSSQLSASVTLGTTITIDAGFFILNDLQTTINEAGEGYYIGFADNSSAASLNFDSILGVKTLSSNTTGSNFASIASDRLDFELSATKIDSDSGVFSVSESLEKVGFSSFESQSYQDHLSLGLFKIRKSTSNPLYLTLASTEKYLFSFDYNRRQINASGNTISTSFAEDIVNDASPTIKINVNPAISKNHFWTNGSNIPVSRISADPTTTSFLFPLGTFVPQVRTDSSTKIIGNVPDKLEKAFRSLELVENTTVDIVVDAGLSNIYATTSTKGPSAYDDEIFISDPAILESSWREVTNVFLNFCENVRKDCVAIIDPPRSIFVSGKDEKTIDEPTKTFSQDIYGKLKLFADKIETNYAAMYANWVKIPDNFTSRRFWAPFSGYAAAVYARSDAAANTWAAPAGLNRGLFNVIDIAFNPNQKQRDRLYEIALNPVVFFNGDGFAIMGQKTLQNKPTAFDRINVRRLFLTLERTVSRTIKYFVFEPNTDFTRLRVKNVITPVFDYAKETDGLYDFLIVADERNNTPDRIDDNELIVDIYLKPVRTAEFILVNFIATRTGQNFQELI